jgi:hypothetical protein
MRKLLLGALSAALTLSACIAVQAQENRFVVFSHGKHGYIDREGKLVIPISLEGTYVLHFNEGLVSYSERVKPEPTKLPYMDQNGMLRIHPQEKWGFIDTSGAVVINAQFDAVGEFSEGLAAVAFDTDKTRHDCFDCSLDQHWGFIDTTGKTVVRPQYSAVSSFSEGLAAVRNEQGKWGYIDTKGTLVIPFAFQSARQFIDGLAPAAVNQKVGYIDREGNFVIKPQFAIAGSFSEGLAAVRRGGKTDVMVLGPAGGKWAFIGKDGKNRIVLPAQAEHAGDFVDGLAAIQFGKSCGYMDKSGALVIPTSFSSCGDFSEGLADVYSDGKWQFIDKKGHVFLDAPYEQVGPFKDGLASVDEGTSGPNQKFGYINKDGKQIWKPQPSL